MKRRRVESDEHNIMREEYRYILTHCANDKAGELRLTLPEVLDLKGDTFCSVALEEISHLQKWANTGFDELEEIRMYSYDPKRITGYYIDGIPRFEDQEADRHLATEVRLKSCEHVASTQELVDYLNTILNVPLLTPSMIAMWDRGDDDDTKTPSESIYDLGQANVGVHVSMVNDKLIVKNANICMGVMFYLSSGLRALLQRKTNNLVLAPGATSVWYPCLTSVSAHPNEHVVVEMDDIPSTTTPRGRRPILYSYHEKLQPAGGYVTHTPSPEIQHHILPTPRSMSEIVLCITNRDNEPLRFTHDNYPIQDVVDCMVKLLITIEHVV